MAFTIVSIIWLILMVVFIVTWCMALSNDKFGREFVEAVVPETGVLLTIALDRTQLNAFINTIMIRIVSFYTIGGLMIVALLKYLGW